MKKLLLIAAVLSFGIMEMFGQTFMNVVLDDPKSSLYPLMSENTYSTVINVSGSKVDMMNAVKAFLMEHYGADEEEVSKVKIDESMNEFRFPIGLMEGQTVAKGMMGMKYVAPPVILLAEAVFTFDDNDPGHVTLTITNFNGSILCWVNDDHEIGTTKKSVSKDVGYGKYEMNEYDEKIAKEQSTLLTLGSGIGAFLIISQAGTAAYEESVAEFKKKQKEQFDMYAEAMEFGSTELITKDNIGGYGRAGFTGKNEQMWINLRDKFASGECVLGVNKFRWENSYQPYFDGMFRSITAVMGGTIQSVSYNDEMIYEEYEGKVLPVDPKERKKWIKKDMSY